MKEIVEVKRNRLIYLITGLSLLMLGVYINIGYLNRGEFPDAILIIVLAINQLSWAYVTPHVFPKDERSKSIREKAMTFNHYSVLVVIVVLLFITLQVDLTAYQALVILAGVYILSISFAMIFFAKRI